MEKNRVEEAIKQLKIAISNMKDVKSFTLEQNDTNYEIIVESQDEISYKINLTMMDIYFCIIKYGINAFCLTFTYEIEREFIRVRKINKALEKAYKNKNTYDIEKLMKLKYEKEINIKMIRQYVTTRERRWYYGEK